MQPESEHVDQIADFNRFLKDATPVKTIQWALSHADKPVMFTNFRPFSVALLHMVISIEPKLPVIWVDTGYNTDETYHYVERLTKHFNLNLNVYTPQMTARRRDTIAGGIPEIDTKAHKAFTQEVKLEPFDRALRELRADLWFTGVRREQTSFRNELNLLSPGPRSTLKVAPLLDWTEQQVENYICAKHLPNYSRYFDPTKGLDHRECGLQLLA